MEEIWKAITFDQRYEVSSFGNVRKKLVRRRPHKPIIPDVGRKGYLRVYIHTKEGNGIRISVHRLVATHFLSNPNNLPQINHIDGDPSNNRVDNLEYCDASHNLKHSYKMGHRSAQGEKNNIAKLTDESVLSIRQLWETGSYFQREIAQMFNIDQSLVSMVVNRKIWNHI